MLSWSSCRSRAGFTRAVEAPGERPQLLHLLLGERGRGRLILAPCVARTATPNSCATPRLTIVRIVIAISTSMIVKPASKHGRGAVPYTRTSRTAQKASPLRAARSDGGLVELDATERIDGDRFRVARPGDGQHEIGRERRGGAAGERVDRAIRAEFDVKRCTRDRGASGQVLHR